jgi:hypothetical protein
LLVIATLLVSTVARAEPGPRKLHVDNHRLVAEDEHDFPAVSDDGTLLVHLVVDESASTMVVWTNNGQRLEEYKLPGGNGNESYEQGVAKRANARLAKKQWRTLPWVAATANGTTVKLDGATIAFDAKAQRLSVGGKVSPHRFPLPGSNAKHRNCGSYKGIAGGFGGKAVGGAVLVPTPVTEDGCTVRSLGSLAMAFAITSGP